MTGANLLYRTAYMNAAVTINHEMITYAEKATLTMPTVYVGYCVVATLFGRTAMNKASWCDKYGAIASATSSVPGMANGTTGTAPTVKTVSMSP